MTTIHKLDRQTVNSIAAGEVVERPASVVKELIDNALDAGASIIRLAIRNGGIREIRCEDDGQGMSREDALLSVESHATSKIETTDDLFSLQTMGFRGEALPSIASVSRLELVTRRRDDKEGTRVVVEGGEMSFQGPHPMTQGTTVTVRDLFFNTPARYKFLKSDSSEAGAIADIVGKLALSRPDVSFRLERLDDDREMLYTPGNNDLLSAIYVVFGKDTAEKMIPVSVDDGPVRLTGFMTRADAARHNRARQLFLVNGRVIQSSVLRTAVEEASRGFFMKGKFTQLVFNIEIAPNLIDVNVHPQKTEVRFWDDRAVFRAIYHAVKGTLEDSAVIQDSSLEQLNKEEKEASYEPQQVAFDTSRTIVRDQKTIKESESEREPLETIVQKGAEKTLKMDEEKTPASDFHPLKHARFIGAFLNTYLLFEDGDSLVLIDQHAAHERVLYEELLLKRKEKDGVKVPSQTLMAPLHVDLTIKEMALLEDAADHFSLLGFEYEIFGERSVALRAVPMAPVNAQVTLDAKAAFQVVLDRHMTAGESGATVDDNEILHDIACKAAVKAHDRLSQEEAFILIDRLLALTNPYHCPHGRPVALRLTLTDIEKRFGRIV